MVCQQAIPSMSAILSGWKPIEVFHGFRIPKAAGSTMSAAMEPSTTVPAAAAVP